MPEHAAVETKLDAIEAEMKKIGMWQAEAPPPENLVITQAFGADKLAFSQWLQFVFIPRVRTIIAEKGRFPSQSQVADQAFREWSMYDNRPEVETLIDLLRDFDAMF
jgi:uncharacterized protein YqcC (DUF446 family)